MFICARLVQSGEPQGSSSTLGRYHGVVPFICIRLVNSGAPRRSCWFIRVRLFHSGATRFIRVRMVHTRGRRVWSGSFAFVNEFVRNMAVAGFIRVHLVHSLAPMLS